ncbi:MULTISPECIES: protein kinase family protein [unclassified Streptomyces]|uniref:protein kinase family protein n=1 Tax=unclassified Streptomyces TaxID=2593676 RepID=UPI002366A2D6|nr:MULTISPECIES: protein kinase family protein [unclassified Streptomyces]MDF3142001.1 protein kinase family protein [Streptomyces sp. T21Q-yed]WDF39611.1 protein kinase family protein [Streptomyces sp. T12]
MAERSTAAVDVADNSGDEPLTAQADQSTADGVAKNRERDTDTDEAQGSGGTEGPGKASPPELHSGHKLARRYRLEECVTRLDGFSSWRAVDEKLRRAVGVHILPADHARARSVLAAARSSALLGDPRFVQVLDAVEENDLVYVVHEWLPDATELTTLLASGPLEVYDAYQMVTQVSAAMAAAHREGLAHLRLNPNAVLRSSTGQWRIRGLAVNAALRGISSDTPQRTDTEAIGALLYAALTQRWPYESDAYGLSGLPKDVGLIAPDQVRAGVHRGLSELTMRALVNDGATASRHESACATPEELVKAIGEMPRIRPPEPAFTAPPDYQRTTYQQGTYGRQAPHPGATQPVPTPPPPLQSRTGKALKWAVSALLIAALGLGSWQLADALMDQGNKSEDSNQTQTTDEDGGDKPAAPLKQIPIDSVQEFAPSGSGIQEDEVQLAIDGKADTAWVTPQYQGYANFGNLPQRKEGSGLILDLGSVKSLSRLDISMYRSGQTAEVLAADASASAPTSLSDFSQRLTKLSSTGSSLQVELKKPIRTRYVLIHITELPEDGSADRFRGGISEVEIKG